MMLGRWIMMVGVVSGLAGCFPNGLNPPLLSDGVDILTGEPMDYKPASESGEEGSLTAKTSESANASGSDMVYEQDCMPMPEEGALVPAVEGVVYCKE